MSSLNKNVPANMKLKIAFILMWVNLFAVAQVNLSSLKVNHLMSPEGLTEKKPTFSWIITSNERNTMQEAYEIQVFKGDKLIWNSGRVKSDNSLTVSYGGDSLLSATRYFWQVRVWDNHSHCTNWSTKASWLTGLFSVDEWKKASWIEPQKQSEASPLFRKQFSVAKPIASAVLYITSHGMYEASINGNKVGKSHFTPGWTSYEKRLQYQTYDVTGMLNKGSNALGVMLGRGWYLGRIGYKVVPKVYSAEKVGALAIMIVSYLDGSKEIITTDKTWKTSTGEVVFSELYDGETVDARLQQKGWNTPVFDDSKWEAVQVKEYPFDNLVSSESEPVVTHELKSPIAVITTPKGEKVLDFGQNMSGREILTYKGTRGQVITTSHAEVLDEKGNFYTANLRSAKAQGRYVCSGEPDRFEARFTFYGFRYLKVEGIDGNLNPDDFKVAVVFSDMEQTGTFNSSNNLVNQLQSNIQWGLYSNFVDIPSDCPQRDERLGWTGDAQAFFRTATFNRDVQNFFRKWLKDLAADQSPDGKVSHITPIIPGLVGKGNTFWSDASTIIPWQHYMAYGDKQILENQYSSMKKWVDYMVSQSKDYLWTTGSHHGDWLFYSVNNDNLGVSAVTYKPLIQQCFFANSLDILSKSAAVLGKSEDAEHYAEMTTKVKSAFCNAYLTPGGYLVSATQTAFALALNFEMLPEAQRPVVAAHLADNVRQYGHITTGFVGTPFICHVLSEWGYTDLAYKLLLRKEYPGWLYPITMGATTMWERWNAMLPDHTIPSNGMNSFNHYAYGSIGDWLYRDAVGLHETSAGFKTMMIKPHPGGEFTQMIVTELTPYGLASAAWRKDNDAFSMDVSIPVNTTATIFIPVASTDQRILLDNTKLSDVKGIQVEGFGEGYIKVKVGSGTYRFVVPEIKNQPNK